MRKDVLPFFAGPLARAARTAARPLLTRWPSPALQGRHLGAAQVRQVTPEGLPVVRLSDPWGTERVAEWALPYRYEPKVGDLLRVIAQGERCYVIGVVQGRGRSRLVFQGDATVRASGVLRLRSSRALQLKGEEVAIRARDRLQVVARELQEILGDATRVVKGLLEVRAANCGRVIDGTDTVVGGQVEVLAVDKVLIDGQRIEIQ